MNRIRDRHGSVGFYLPVLFMWYEDTIIEKIVKIINKNDIDDNLDDIITT